MIFVIACIFLYLVGVSIRRANKKRKLRKIPIIFGLLILPITLIEPLFAFIPIFPPTLRDSIFYNGCEAFSFYFGYFMQWMIEK